MTKQSPFAQLFTQNCPEVNCYTRSRGSVHGVPFAPCQGWRFAMFSEPLCLGTVSPFGRRYDFTRLRSMARPYDGRGDFHPEPAEGRRLQKAPAVFASSLDGLGMRRRTIRIRIQSQPPYRATSTTRRFLARPSSSSLGAAGARGPTPRASSRSPAIPRATSASLTALARRLERSRL